MRMSRQDMLATILVLAATAIWVLFAVDVALPGLGSVRATALVLLGCGFAASASAVVPTFDRLLHGNKTYLATTSLLGVAAFVGGLMALISASVTGLVLLVGATVALWLISTMHHQHLGGSRSANAA